jgi:hypothetical protein
MVEAGEGPETETIYADIGMSTSVLGGANDRHRHVGRDEEEPARHDSASIRCLPRCFCLNWEGCVKKSCRCE